jgi:hypothetical protein
MSPRSIVLAFLGAGAIARAPVAAATAATVDGMGARHPDPGHGHHGGWGNGHGHGGWGNGHGHGGWGNGHGHGGWGNGHGWGHWKHDRWHKKHGGWGH